MAKSRTRRTSASVDDSESLVVYIHGIGRHPPRDALKLEWDLALFGRDREPATRMAYWSDVVHPVSERSTKAAGRDDSIDTDAILADAGVSRRDAA